MGVQLIAKDFDPFAKIIKSADKLLLGLNKTVVSTVASINRLEARTRKLTTTLRASNTQYSQSAIGARRYETAVKGLETGVSDLAIRAQSGVAAIGRFESAQTRASESASDLTRNLSRADSRLRSLNQNLRAGGLSQLGSGMTSAGRGAATLTDNLRGTVSKIKEVGSSAANAAGKITDFATSLAKKAATGLLALGAAGTIAAGVAVNTAASYESAFIGVGKTVDGLVELGTGGFLELTDAGETFKDSLLELTETTLPTTFENAAKVAELGGQLGFVSSIDDIGEAQAALLAFTETIIGLEEATDLTAEAAAQDLSRFANIFQDDFDDAGENIRNIGNTIVELGNTSATTESQIVSFATRMAGTSKAAGLSQADVLGISAAFSSIGINAEAGGTAVSKVLLEMQKAANATNEGFVDNTEAIIEQERKQRDLVGQLRSLEHNTGLSAEAILAQQEAFVAAGGSVADFGEQLGDTRQRRLLGMIEDINELADQTEQLKRTHGTPFSSQLLANFLKVTGTTREEFQRLQKEEPAELFAMLIEGIADQGDEAGATLEALGFNTSQLRQAMLGMAQNTDLLVTSLEVANDEFENGNALAEETAKRYATFDSRLQRFKNTIRNTAAEIGSVFLPAISNMLSGAAPVIGVFGDRIPDVIDSVMGKIGELAGLEVGEFDFVTSINAGFDTLIALIDSFDMTPVQTAINTVSTDVLPTLWSWLSLVTDNWETFEDIIVAFGTAAGVAVTVAALVSIGTSLLALLNPITLAIAGVTGLAFAWNTNLGGIQEKTEGLVTTVTESVTGITDAFETEGLEGVFDFLEIPEGIQTGVSNLLSSFDDLTIGTSIQDFFDNLGELFSGDSMDVILAGVGIVGDAIIGLGGAVLALGAVAVSTTLDQLQGLIDIGANLIGFFDSLLELDSTGIAESLGGVAEGLLSVVVAPFENIGEAITGIDLDFVTPVQDALTLAGDALLEYVWPAIPLPSLPEDAEALDFAALISDPLGVASDLITSLVWPEIPLPTLPEGLSEFVTQLTAPFADIELPEAFSELQAQITDLFSGESAEKIGDAATAIGEGVGSLVSALVELATPTVVDTVSNLGVAITVVVGAVASLAAVGISTAIEVVAGIVEAVAALVGIVDSILDSDLIGATTQIDNFMSALGSIALAPLENIAELFAGEDVDLAGAISTWVNDASMALTEFEWPEIPEFEWPEIPEFELPELTFLTALTEFEWPEIPEFVWPELGAPELDLSSLGEELFTAAGQIKSFFSDLLTDVDIGEFEWPELSEFTWPALPDFTWPEIGLPEFPDLDAKIDEILQGIKDKFTGFLTDIDIGVPETLVNIAGAVGIDLGDTEDDAKSEGKKVGTAVTEGFAEGQIENAQAAKDAAADVSEQTWGEWATSWVIGSPSERTKQLGRDVTEGFALGLLDSQSLPLALETLNTLVLTAFQGFADTLTSITTPSLETFIFTTDNLNQLILPVTISLLNDELIPAKITLASTNDDTVTPSVDRLAASEQNLGAVIEANVIPSLRSQITVMIEAKTKGKNLDKVIKSLTKRYLALAAAITAAKNAGSGLGGTPAGPSPAASLQSGGQFVVPSTIPKQFQTPSGGMLAEVHPGELVTVVSAPQVAAPKPIKDRATSGAIFQQDVASVSSSSQTENSFNLHVTEVVSKDVRTSFSLLQSLGGVN